MRPKTQGSCKYSLMSSTLEFGAVKAQPGPGAYEPKSAINDKGNYFLSKFKNSLATSIDPPSSNRFKEFSGNNP